MFDGANAGCARVMSGTSPLDDPGLVLVAHALFTIDGDRPSTWRIPAGKPLDFYAEAFASTTAAARASGAAASRQSLAAGGSTGVTIAISASD